jgi:putative peptidoglycan lipid II flippase
MASPSSGTENAAAGSLDAREPAPGGEEPRKSGSGLSLGRAASSVSSGVFVSRILGLVREQVLAYLFPAKVGLDAFYAAFRIPNLLRDMFGEGALSKAFVATFSEIQELESKKEAFRVASSVLNAIVLIVGALTVLGMVYADTLVGLIFQGGGFDVPLDPETSFGFATKRDLTVFLTRLMFPFILLVCVAALVMGILNARGRFFVPALASSFFNVGSIVVGVAGYFLAPELGYHPTVGMAVGVLAGGLLQLGWQLPSLFRVGYRYTLELSWNDPRFQKVLRLFAPGALIASTVQVNLLVNSIFASRGEGWLTWIVQAFRIVHLPIGLVGVAVSVATLPALSRAAAQNDREGFRETFSLATRLVVLFTVPASVGLIVLADPIVRLIFEQGQFGSADTEAVAGALRFYSLGLLSFAAVKIVTDGFYALQDIRAPLVVSVLSMFSNVVLNWLFVVGLGMNHTGLALATSTSTSLSFVVLWVLFRRHRRTGRLGTRAVFRTLAQSLGASAAMGASAFYSYHLLDQWLGHTMVWTRLLQVGAAITLGVTVYLFGCRVLRVRELSLIGWR